MNCTVVTTVVLEFRQWQAVKEAGKEAKEAPKEAPKEAAKEPKEAAKETKDEKPAEEACELVLWWAARYRESTELPAFHQNPHGKITVV